MSPAPEYVDFTVDHNHNASPQQHVAANNDPALRKDHEHQHPHLHHDANAKKDREDKVVYAEDTAMGSAPMPTNTSKKPIDTVDVEKDPLAQLQSEEDPQSHRLSSFYSRYRMFFHLFIWLVFTGLVLLLFCHFSMPSTTQSVFGFFIRSRGFRLTMHKLVDYRTRSTW